MHCCKVKVEIKRCIMHYSCIAVFLLLCVLGKVDFFFKKKTFCMCTQHSALIGVILGCKNFSKYHSRAYINDKLNDYQMLLGHQCSFFFLPVCELESESDSSNMCPSSIVVSLSHDQYFFYWVGYLEAVRHNDDMWWNVIDASILTTVDLCSIMQRLVWLFCRLLTRFWFKVKIFSLV